ncbi:ABC transporter ATP-binding protein [Sphaerotilus sp.]|uniref:ABC transporter ATP-binding protein n=1 Tax=Sphaerotilus sp. TaxID=2093942 RepID=UPI00286E5984|nr:ABC transporter ATP-binding protein [Sphaerotilus sp.]
MTTPLLRLTRLGKHYGETAVFQEVSLTMQQGEVVALVGESGVGKSTLLNCIAGLDRADTGVVEIAGRTVGRLTEREAALLRRASLGFVFQAFHVLPHLSVADNVGLPLMLQGWRDRDAIAARVGSVLDEVGLGALGARRPRELSGGQLQRVAIARALVHRPALILADEPTGNLDPVTAQRVLDLLCTQARQHGAGCLIVTHSQAAAAQADRTLRLRADGVQAP